MKKTTLLGLLSLAVCLFTACSSDQNGEDEKTPMGGILTGFSDNEGKSYSDFKYDPLGRLTSVDKKSVITIDDQVISSKQEHITYTYAADCIQKEIVGGHEPIKGIYTLTHGKITQAVIDHQGYNETYLFSYDSDDQLAVISGYGEGGKTTVSWLNGNIDKVTIEYDGMDEKNVMTYTYTNYSAKGFIAFEDLGYCLPILYGVDPALFTQGFYGRTLRNLVETASTAGSYFCNYTLDDKGRVIKIMDSKGYESLFTWK